MYKFPFFVLPSIPPCLALTRFHKPTGYPWWKSSRWKSCFPSWGFPFISSHLQPKKFSSNKWDIASLMSLSAVPPQKPALSAIGVYTSASQCFCVLWTHHKPWILIVLEAFWQMFADK